jgi:hypothetical protein
MLRAGFETEISTFERPKTVHASDRSDIKIGNRSTNDQIFYIRQKLLKKWEYNWTVHQLFINCKKAYDSLKREVLYNILLDFGIAKKQIRLVKMCLNETYIKACVGKLLSDKFPIQNWLR